MDRESIYYRQVQLLVQILPLISEEKCFALKGGTAINLFVRDLPRLSVDIDLVYLPMSGRDEALADIKSALSRISDNIVSHIPHTNIHKAFEDKSDALRLIAQKGDVHIKIELSPVLRGTVYDVETREVADIVENEFGYVEFPVVSLPDLYAGKICAALDRQHPRDLFDVKLFLENEGLTDEIRKATIVYLISHNRPISELLNPVRKDITELFHGEFATMAEMEISIDELVSVREELISQLTDSLTKDEKSFLLSFKQKFPNWELLGLDNVEQMPAIKWKLINLQRMDKTKYQETLKKLETVLSGI